jgi:hypothetical protein
MDGETETQELPMFDDGPTEDVEIEITEDDLGENLADFDEEEEEAEPEAEEAEEEEPEEEEQPEEEASDEDEEEEEEEAPKPKRRRSSENRIAELARRAAEAERRAQELEARVQQEAQLRQQSDIAMMTHYEQRLKREESFIKAQLQDAIAVGDTDQQIELQNQLFQVKNDLSGVDTWRKQAEAEAAAAAAKPAPEPKQQNQQQQVSLEPNTAAWIQRNTWFQPKSADFDPEMHEEATLFAKKVERRLRAEGREDEIGSKDYFRQIDAHIREEFPDAFDDPKPVKKAPPPMRRESNVAAVTRSAPEAQGGKSRTIRLSADERRMAHNMADSGAYRKPNGQRMTHAEAEKYHATFILKQKRK